MTNKAHSRRSTGGPEETLIGYQFGAGPQPALYQNQRSSQRVQNSAT